MTVSTVQCVAEHWYKKTENLAAEKLSSTDHVSVTVDIWSDRKMRGFLGVTAHWIEKEAERIQLKSNLLACNRFKGSHTAERICDQFEVICDKYIFKDKLDYIISDDAANMHKAFTVCFPTEQEDDDDGDHLDDPQLWHNLTQEDPEQTMLLWQRNSACSVLRILFSCWWETA